MNFYSRKIKIPSVLCRKHLLGIIQKNTLIQERAGATQHLTINANSKCVRRVSLLKKEMEFI